VDAKIERVLSDILYNNRSIRIDKKCPIDTKYSLSKWKTRLLQAPIGNPPSKMEKETAVSIKISETIRVTAAKLEQS
jgi:hypothetical protein